ncbi:hypothetical protein HYX13_01065 [Candidatus Woesearchaeota archaeon]|nr:hypothetical protein [Candidatus Woesearchaeota archaeon]
MDNLILLKRNAEIEKLSKELGFERVITLEDVVLITEENHKLLLKKIQQAKQQKKVVICKLSSEETLRFVLEKTPADMVLGVEAIHPKDSLHYLRSGVDQVLCKIAHEKGKTIAFSFADILRAVERPKMMARMMFTIRLCQKYNVKMLFGNFSSTSEEMRSAQDLFSFWRVLGGRKKEELCTKVY